MRARPAVFVVVVGASVLKLVIIVLPILIKRAAGIPIIHHCTKLPLHISKSFLVSGRAIDAKAKGDKITKIQRASILNRNKNTYKMTSPMPDMEGMLR